MRAVTAEEPGQRAGTKPAKDFEDRVPETLQGRGGGRAKRRTTIGFSAKPDLSIIEPATGGAAHSRDGRDPVGETPEPGVGRRIEDVGQTGPQVTGDQPAEGL